MPAEWAASSQRHAVSRPAMASEGSRKNQQSHAPCGLPEASTPLNTRAGPHLGRANNANHHTASSVIVQTNRRSAQACVRIHRRGPMFCTRRGEAKNVSLFGLMRTHILATLTLLLGAFSGSSLWSQTVQGRVVDGDQAPVIGAYITNGSATVATDLDGAYRLELTPGVHTLVCSFIGMANQRKDLTLKTGQQATWNPMMVSAAEALGLVVVSAGRFEQDASEVTVSLEVLQPALVENKATTTLETAIEQTPGVSLVDGEPQIRSGSGFSYGAGSRVMVLVDDLPVLSGDAGRPTWGFLPLENLEQIEVVKGASSVLYGSAALSGVINIRTRYPDARPLTRVSLQHGVYSDPS